MRLGYSIPTDWSYAIAGGDWLETEAGDPAHLCDRAPAERTFYTWPAGAQTTSTTCAITANRSQAFVPYLAMLLNTSLPIGTKVTLLGKRPADGDYTYDLGGNSMTARVQALPDGGNGIIWVLDAGLDAINAFKRTAYNDVDGIAGIAAESVQSDGELVVMRGVLVDHEVGPEERWTERTVSRTLGSQASISGPTPHRSVSLRSVVLAHDQVRGDQLQGTSWQQVCNAIARDPFVLLVMYDEDAGELSQLSGIYGIAKGLGTTGLAARQQQTDRLTVDEIPSA